ncbi:hypothetical protein SAMN02745165_01679 [Malonomonas rubra DSM 5091]|uniref:DUF3108 domain-containing protein n=1 Tax=Malonomonas rubra DSM 5091 TaxID=1122189 RepID=A0A1M6H460_MALRU|nr:hypothetical protein [Malonomonas rubra]SHJ16985.1 hypothetical protein SAMN02745165_01679 [Malonomonas rubra DSM 5091]
MRKLKIIGSALLFWLCCTQSLLAATVLEQHQYTRTFGTETATMRWQRLSGDPEQIVTEINAEVDRTEMDVNLATRSWRVSDEEKKTQLKIERHFNHLHLTGTFAGEAIDHWKNIDEAPWFQTMSISFRPFLDSSDEKIRFWIVRPDTLGIHKLKAIKKGIEILEIQGEQIKAQKIELRLSGLAAPFWKATYWFREGDHLFLRYLGPGGLPGSPKIVVEISSPLNQAGLAAMKNQGQL